MKRMKRCWTLSLCVIFVVLLTACGVSDPADTQVIDENETLTTTSDYSETDSTIEEVEVIEDSCENPKDSSHYPKICSFSKGKVGNFLVTTTEHGTEFDGATNGFGMYVGTALFKGGKGYSSKEDAIENPLEIESRGHEITITLSYWDYTETFKMNSGDVELLEVRRTSYTTERAYLYVIVI